MIRILRVFEGVSMINGHDGLTAVAKRFQVNLHKLEPGEMVVFINKAKNKFKLYTSGDTFAYRRVKGGIDLRAIQEVPRFFSGGKFSYDDALLAAISKKLKRERPDVLRAGEKLSEMNRARA